MKRYKNYSYEQTMLTHKVDKSLYSGIIYAKSVDNSDTVTNPALPG
jgi:hypothetical protein